MESYRTFFRSEIDKLRRKAGAYVDNEFLKGLQHKVTERGFSKVRLEVEQGVRSDRDRTILLHYPNVIESPGYLPPRVKIEFSCRSLMEPASQQNFNSEVDKAFPEAEFTEPHITVATVNPERTLLEKIFLLHEEFQKPPEKIRKGDRLSRHLYDVAKLSVTKFVETALSGPELYRTIVFADYTNLQGRYLNNRYKTLKAGFLALKYESGLLTISLPGLDKVKLNS